MTTDQAYTLGQRAARAETRGDEDGARALVRDGSGGHGPPAPRTA
jgi:hypothetical protein